MKTIRRNSTRIIAEIKKSIVSVVFYNQNTGGLEPATLEHAMDAMDAYDFSKLYDQGDGKYTVHVHSNLWYYLYTQAHLDQLAADKAAREQRAATYPKPVRPSTREERQARVLASTASIHDLGKTAPAPAVTVTRTRMAIGDQIAQACAALNIKLGHGWDKGTSCYVVDGRNYTASELADLVLEGGFAANYGGNEVRVNWNSPLVLAKGSVERMGVNVVMLRALQGELKDPRAVEGVGKAAQIMLDTLHGWAIEDAPREKVDFPSGAAEPGKDVTAVQCARTGEIFTRTGSWWTQKRTGLQATWYQMNITDPMSEGFRIYREGSR